MSATANTMHWDTVFALRVSEVNAAIKKQGRSPTVFSGETDFPTSVKGQFDDWRLSPEGSSNLAVMILPVKNVDFLKKDGSVVLSDKNLEIHINVELDYLAADMQSKVVKKPKTVGGSIHHLKVKTTATASNPEIVTIKKVTAVSGNFADPEVPMIIASGIKKWLKAHLKDFEHIFAELEVNKTGATGDFSFLMPSDIGYAFASAKKENDAILGILCTTNGRTAKGLASQVGVGSIPTGHPAAFVVGTHCFMQDLMIPGIETAFPGIKPKDLALDSDALGFSLTKQVKLKPIVHNGDTYYPTMELLSVRLLGDRLNIIGTTATQVSPGVTAHTTTSSEYQITLAKNKKGKPTLHLKEITQGQPTTWTTKSKGLTIAGYIALAISALVGILIAVCTLGTATLVGLLIIGIAAGLVMVGTTAAQAFGRDASPSLDKLICFISDPISWSDSKDFVLKAAGLNDALQFSGHLTKT